MKSTRRLHAVAKNNGTSSALAHEGLIVTDLSLEPIAADWGATAILSGAGQDRAKVAEILLSIPKELRDVLSSRNTADLPLTKMHFRLGTEGYNCRAFLVRPHNRTMAQPMLALHLQKDSSVADAIDVFASQYHLSVREQEVLKGIATGLTTKEMAERLAITPNTVKSFLRIIMIKMGVATRAGILGRLLEYSNNQHGSAAVTGA